MFQKLKNLLRPRAEQRGFKPLLGLSSQEIGVLKEFRHHDGYEIFLQALDVIVNLQGEVMLSTREDAIVHETRGHVLGLRRAATLIDEILIQEDADRTQRERRATNAEHAPDPRNLSFFGSPSWGRYS